MRELVIGFNSGFARLDFRKYIYLSDVFLILIGMKTLPCYFFRVKQPKSPIAGLPGYSSIYTILLFVAMNVPIMLLYPGSYAAV